jgi:hypothetical protein
LAWKPLDGDEPFLIELEPYTRPEKLGPFLLSPGKVARYGITPTGAEWLFQRRLVFSSHPRKAERNFDREDFLTYTVEDEWNEDRERKQKFVIQRDLEEIEKSLPKMNDLINVADIQIKLPRYESFKACSTDKSRPLRMMQDNNTLYRIFSENDGQAGRIYGHWSQYIPSAMRHHITINGESVIELDFKGCNVFLAYHLAGEHLSACDPYIVEGYGRITRAVFKALFTRAIGCKTRQGAISSLSYWLEDNGWDNLNANSLFADFFSQHRAIDTLCRKGRWRELQSLDSEVMLLILDLMADRGIVTLPIHDGAIVQARHEETLRWAMTKACQIKGISSIPPIEKE